MTIHAVVSRKVHPHVLLHALGDGAFYDRLCELASSKRVDPELLSESVESTARDLYDVLETLSDWDDDLASEVHTAALTYMQAVERFCRDVIESRRA
jgi:hypothetical protein